jgi:hypothetical protein
MSTYTGPTPFTGDGSTLGPYAFSWGYLEANDVHVYVDGSPKVSGTDYNALAAGPQTSGSITFKTGRAPANGALIQITRTTDAAYEFYSSGTVDNAALNLTAKHGPYMAEEAKAMASAASGSATAGLYGKRSDLITAVVPSSLAAINILGLTTAGDGGGGIYKRVASAPSHNAYVQSLDGAYWELAAPNLYHKFFLRDFLALYTNPVTALREAFKALFAASATDYDFVLECEGIPITLSAPFLLRSPTDLNVGTTWARSGRLIRNLNLIAQPFASGGTWASGDYLFSIAGQAGVGNDGPSLSFVCFDRPSFNLNGITNLVGFHFSGTAKPSIFRPIIQNVGPGGVGIYNSKFIFSTGLTNFSASILTDPYGAGHGLVIRDAEIGGQGANDTITGILLENGDTNVEFCRFTNVGVCVKTLSGGNFRSNHYSPGDSFANPGKRVISVWATNSRGLLAFTDEEVDKSYYLLEDSSNTLEFDNSGNHLGPSGAFSQVVFDRIRITSSSEITPDRADAPGTPRGYITFVAYVANTILKNSLIDFATAGNTDGGGTIIPPVVFETSGSGTWDSTSTQPIRMGYPHGSNMVPVTWPGKMVEQIVRAGYAGGQAGVAFSPNHAAGPGIELWDATTTTRPHIGAAGTLLNFNINGGVGVTNKSFSMSQSVFRGASDNACDLGNNSNYFKDFYLKGNLLVNFGTVTAAAGAATLNNKAGVVTTENLTTAAGADYTLVLTNSSIAATDMVLVQVSYGNMTAGIPHLLNVTPAAGSVTIVVRNIHASAAFDNKNLKIRFLVLKA